MSGSRITGQCHCGNVSFTLCWTSEPATLASRSCKCSFCRPRAASWASVPHAELEIDVRAPALVSRYTFATHTAVFHVCSRCGGVPVSTSQIDGAVYGAINAMTLVGVGSEIVRSHDVDFADEQLAARLARRQRDWITDVRFTRAGIGGVATAPRVFRTERVVLFGDCDPGGIVYMPRVADFVAEAVLEFMSARLGTPAARHALETGIVPPARLLAIEFLAPMTYDDRLEIEVSVEYVAVHSISLAVCARKPDQTATFRARLVQVFCVAADGLRKVAVPEELRAKLAS